MSKSPEKNLQELEFINLLRKNRLQTPNEFTIKMGQLIKKAREENGLSQAELGRRINRRPATISDIENGKSEIGVLTLVAFAIELNKTISYFFPGSLLKEFIADVKTPFQNEMLEIAQGIEVFGDEKLTLDILEALNRFFTKDEYDIFEKK